MRCSNCGYENPQDVAFCENCGSKLTWTCPGCGAENPPNSAFCENCGTAQVAGGPPPWICSNCGAANPAGAGFCETCGTPYSPAPYIQPQQVKSHTIRNVIIAIIIIAAIAGAALFFILGKGGISKPGSDSKTEQDQSATEQSKDAQDSTGKQDNSGKADNQDQTDNQTTTVECNGFKIIVPDDWKGKYNAYLSDNDKTAVLYCSDAEDGDKSGRVCMIREFDNCNYYTAAEQDQDIELAKFLASQKERAYVLFTYKDDGSGADYKKMKDEAKDIKVTLDEGDSIKYADQYIFPNDEYVVLTQDDVKYLNEDQAGIANNELLARKDVIFNNEKWNDYFSKNTDWYKGRVAKDEMSPFSNIEQQNHDLLVNLRENNGWIILK